MSEQRRGDSGEFAEKVTDQDVLKAFDAADAPFMTAGELATVLPISRSGVNQRLRRMREAGLVGRKETGSRAVGWWAEVAPQLSATAIEGTEESDRQRERGEVVSLEETHRRLGLDE